MARERGKPASSPKGRSSLCRGLKDYKRWFAPLCLLLYCILLVPAPQPVAGWITLDGGENVTLHGHTNIGPWDTLSKYDLNVYGDVRVGKVSSVDPFAVEPGVNVEGAVTTSRIILQDSGKVGQDSDLVEARKLLQALEADSDPDFVFVSTFADTSSLGFVESHTVT